jgi:hypothetical protein
MHVLTETIDNGRWWSAPTKHPSSKGVCLCTRAYGFLTACYPPPAFLDGDLVDAVSDLHRRLFGCVSACDNGR